MAKHNDSRGIRDEMNVGPDPRNARHLKPLRELGKLHVADGEPDVRGWDVYTSTGREIGTVHELLVDTEAGEVVMLDVDLKRNDRHTLTPLRAAWIDHAAHRVVVDANEVTDADQMPALTRNARMSDEEARNFDERYARAYGTHDDDREYRVRHGEEELRFNRRAADLGHAGERGSTDAAAAPAASTPAPTDASVPRRSQRVERHPLQEPERYRGNEASEGLVRYRRRDDLQAGQRPDEVVVERRPYVEEVVVRRRAADDAVGGQGTAPDLPPRRDLDEPRR